MSGLTPSKISTRSPYLSCRRINLRFWHLHCRVVVVQVLISTPHTTMAFRLCICLVLDEVSTRLYFFPVLVSYFSNRSYFINHTQHFFSHKWSSMGSKIATCGNKIKSIMPFSNDVSFFTFRAHLCSSKISKQLPFFVYHSCPRLWPILSSIWPLYGLFYTIYHHLCSVRAIVCSMQAFYCAVTMHHQSSRDPLLLSAMPDLLPM